MAETSKIQWTDATFNPWWGCVKISQGCDHCYADTFSKRTGNRVWGKEAPRRFFGDKHWNEPLKWNAAAAGEGVRKRVFCGSMCDVMEDRRDLDEYRERLYRLIEATPHLDWQLLTKRPQNFRRFLPKTWLARPVPNVWGMTTVESNFYRWRIDALAETPFAVRGLSCEPMVDELRIGQSLLPGKIHWVICGGESGVGARPMQLEWANSLRNQCKAAGVAFFMKQIGGVRDKRGEIDVFPEEIRVRQFPNAVWIASAPELDIISQGDSREDAKRMLAEAVKLSVTTTYERLANESIPNGR